MRNKSKSPIRIAFGQAIKQRRIALGFSQEKTAELIDCHRNYIGNVERGEQNITLDMLSRFASALQTSPSALLSFYKSKIKKKASE